MVVAVANPVAHTFLRVGERSSAVRAITRIISWITVGHVMMPDTGLLLIDKVLVLLVNCNHGSRSTQNSDIVPGVTQQVLQILWTTSSVKVSAVKTTTDHKCGFSFKLVCDCGTVLFEVTVPLEQHKMGVESCSG